jgi:hypothetical protein
MGVKLTSSAMACAMCHPFASDTHPQAFPKFQVSMNKFAKNAGGAWDVASMPIERNLPISL